MAVAYESDGGTVFAAAASNAAITVPLPATRPVGSVLLFVGFCRLITATVSTAPSGFTLLTTLTSGTASGGRIWLYAKEVVGGESAPTFATNGATGTSGDLWGACIYCYSGVDLSGGISAILDGTPTTTDASGTTTCTYPALTISNADSMIVQTLARFRDATDTFTPTATWNEREDLGSTTRTGGQHHLQDKLASASGSQASVTVAPSNTTAARYLAVTLALKATPAPQAFSIGSVAAAAVTRGVTLSGTGAAAVSVGREATVASVFGVTLAPSGAASVTTGKVAIAIVVRGVTLAGGVEGFTLGKVVAATVVRGAVVAPSGAAQLTLGKRAALTSVRGVTLGPSGAAPLALGKRQAAATIRGVALAGAGTAQLAVGKLAAASSVRGVNVFGEGTGIAVGNVDAATQARGITLVGGPAQVAIGARAAATVVRGATLAATGTVAITIGRRTAATTVRGLTLVVIGDIAVAVGRVGTAITVRGLTITEGVAVHPGGLTTTNASGNGLELGTSRSRGSLALSARAGVLGVSSGSASKDRVSLRDVSPGDVELSTISSA